MGNKSKLNVGQINHFINDLNYKLGISLTEKIISENNTIEKLVDYLLLTCGQKLSPKYLSDLFHGNVKQLQDKELVDFVTGYFDLPPASIDAQICLDEYGIDQVTVSGLLDQINIRYSSKLSITDFDGFPTVEEIAKKLTKQQIDSKLSKSEETQEFQSEVSGHSVPLLVSGNDDPAILIERTQEYFRHLLAETLKIPFSSIDANAPLDKYGIDSVMIIQLNAKLEKVFGSLSKTLFYEYKNLKSLGAYFVQNHREKMQTLLMAAESNQGTAISAVTQSAASEPPPARQSKSPRARLHSTGGHIQSSRDIAIIGLAGKYPQAENLDEFLDNLIGGKDCISDVPANRWNWADYFDADKSQEGKTNTKWGGFLESVDEFDPLFFHISPREAALMDPQERLFLECSYKTLEDAGYTKSNLPREAGHGANVGVYVGVMYEEYQLWGAQAQADGRMVALNGNASSIANRVSYYFDLQGPSLAVDTMCSSSLTAIHLACQALSDGDCAMALAGGVNVSVHPNKYLLLGRGKFASSKGKCESFGEGGDGYVPGEGVGAVLLKPLEQAVSDGDHIYGVIKGSRLNAGGKTNGYTVPNPVAQTDLIREAIANAGIDGRNLSYVEAHGTGTSLGDPIEIAGLTKTFRDFTGANQYCPIASVKSNIGHLESAAGIAALTKVLLQIRERKIFPSLHSAQLNPNIDFEDTPFYVPQTLEDWSTEGPYLAGISSFGAGGANAHMIIQEYLETRFQKNYPGSGDPVIIVLSAPNAEGLQGRARDLLKALGRKKLSDADLPSLSYTLQTGRDAMDYRLGFTATTIADIINSLQSFLGQNHSDGRIMSANIVEHTDTIALFVNDPVMEAAVNQWIEAKNFSKIAQLWVQGLDFDWNRLYELEKPLKMSLPAYVFRKEKYWYTQDRLYSGQSTGSPTILHPLVQVNVSDFYGQRFESQFTGREFFFRGHVIQGQKILPAAAYVEMARESLGVAWRTAGQSNLTLKIQNLHFSHPLVVGDQPVKIGMTLNPGVGDEVGFVVSDAKDEAIIFSEGILSLTDSKEALILDVVGWQTQTWSARVTGEQCYAAFAAAGMVYGPENRNIDYLLIASNQVMAHLVMSPQAVQGKSDFGIHPGLLDSVFQALIGFYWKNSAGGAHVPVSIRTLQIGTTLPQSCWVTLQKTSRADEFDLLICSEQGLQLGRIDGLSTQLRTIRPTQNPSKNYDCTELGFFRPSWRELIDGPSPSRAFAHRYIFLLDSLWGQADRLEELLDNCTCIALERVDSLAANGLNLIRAVQELLVTERPVDALIQTLVPGNETIQNLGWLSAVMKTLQAEMPGELVCQFIESEPNAGPEINASLLAKAAARPDVPHWKSTGDKLLTFNLETSPFPDQTIELPWKAGGVYVITGGLGGLGRIFASEIARTATVPVIVLIGQSALNPEKQLFIQGIENQGATVVYRVVDLGKFEAVADLIQETRNQYGRINGIIHSAGLLQDSLLIKKTEQQISEVYRPKIQGLLHLDMATKDLELDFIVTFSSIAAVLGNRGQSDYGSANAFMDGFIHFRNQLVRAGKRFGYGLSINWPLWRSGGMSISPENEQLMQQITGLVPLQSANGIKAFYQALASGFEQIVVIEGDTDKFRKYLESHLPVGDPSIDQFYQDIFERISANQLSQNDFINLINDSIVGAHHD